jgi:cellulose synthase (UDP-forming)
MSLAAIAQAVRFSLQTSSIGYAIVIFWLVVNTKNIVLATFFMVGRNNYRNSERFYVTLDVEINAGHKMVDGKTLDISEKGLALVFDLPEYLPPDEEVKLKISYSVYQAEMQVRVAHVEKRPDGKWKYCLSITDIDDDNIKQYYQIVYDRHHSMPDKVADNWSMFDDFSLNVSKRLDTTLLVQRKLPRLVTSIPVKLETGDGIITSFNYRYISIHLPDTSEIPALTEVRFEFESLSFTLQLNYETQLPHNKEMLFAVKNYEDFLGNDGLDRFVTSISDISNTITAKGYIKENENEFINNFASIT